ncbi:MAG: hypothetical protein KJ578_14460 [Bacteroidetes bacterium]|nr:hypothetical protein [Bacteroidota bacterium]MBU1580894.1 hypothetical protein [Bacteroidota bacterium]MBU2558977.1 hypothetical protein [Bacteroidota bacterium]
MLINSFLSHQFKKARRSSIWQKNIALNVLLIFVGLVLLAEAIGLSILLAFSWHEIVSEAEVLSSFFKVSAYYFVGSAAIRFFMQQLPAMEIIHYQTLPIKKKHLIHFILVKGKFNFFVLLSFILFTPFAFKQVAYYEGTTTAWIWLIGMILIDLIINYFILYIKKQMVTNLKTVTIILVFLGLLVAGDILKWYNFSELFARAVSVMNHQPLLWTIPLAVFAAVYLLNYKFLYNRLYIEEIGSQKTDIANGSRFDYLRKFGLLGEVITLDIKLFTRNKRTKSILYLTPLFLAYGLIFYPNDAYSNDSGFMIFIGIFITGFLMLNYLQYAFAYEGSYFDYLITSGIDFQQYVRAKMFLATTVVVLAYFLTIPYLYFGTQILFINTATALFNLGVVIPMALYFATYNKKAMTLSRGSAFNYQGVNATHWLIMLPVFIVPTMIYLPFKWLGNPDGGLFVLGGIGMIALPFRRFISKMIVKNLNEKKYIMAAGFREKN